MSIQSIQNAYTCIPVSAHNFLNIQRIFNPKKVLECWESGLSNHILILYMSILSIQVVILQCNSVLVISTRSTLLTYRFDGMVGKPWFPAFQNFFRIENPLNIKEVMSQSVLAMSTLLIWRIKKCNLIVCMSRLLIQRLWNTKHSMVCMSILSIQGLNYSVYPNSNYLNWKILQINALNYMKLRIKALYYFELEALWIRFQLNSLRISGTLN